MKLQQCFFKADHNGIKAGTYAWFTTKSEACRAAMTNTDVIETTPNRIWRARIK